MLVRILNGIASRTPVTLVSVIAVASRPLARAPASRATPLMSRTILGTVLVAVAVVASCGDVALSDPLVPNQIFSNTYHVTAVSGSDGSLEDTQAGALTAATNGVIEYAIGNGQIDGFDTWQSDNTGVGTDFVGLGYESPAAFEILTVELGNQFVDGGDWEE